MLFAWIAKSSPPGLSLFLRFASLRGRAALQAAVDKGDIKKILEVLNVPIWAIVALEVGKLLVDCQSFFGSFELVGFDEVSF